MLRYLLPFIFVCCAWPQDGATPEHAAKVVNVVLDRVGFLGGVNYGYAEWFEVRETKHPKWALIGPDVGMIFFSNIGRYRELFAGAGFEVKPTEAMTIDHEAILEQATGIDGGGKTWYLPWTRAVYQFPKHLVSEVVVFPYVPLNGGTTQLIIERSKLEYEGFRHFNFGGGYSGRRDFSDADWQHKPFATITWKSRTFGRFEFWLQALPNHGFQFQSRHAFTWRSIH